METCCFYTLIGLEFFSFNFSINKQVNGNIIVVLTFPPIVWKFLILMTILTFVERLTITMLFYTGGIKWDDLNENSFVIWIVYTVYDKMILTKTQLEFRFSRYFELHVWGKTNAFLFAFYVRKFPKNFLYYIKVLWLIILWHTTYGVYEYDSTV